MIKHISKTKKTFDLDSKHRMASSKFTLKETHEILNKMILAAIYGIIDYKSHEGFSVHHLDSVKNIERDTPISFQDRFFLLMDIIAPCKEYARVFIKRDHPEALFLYDLFIKLYLEEAETNSSPEDINNVD